MHITDNILYLDGEVGYHDCEELISLSKDVEEIVVESDDVHASIFQILFSLSQDKVIKVEDEFNKRFFENLKVAS